MSNSTKSIESEPARILTCAYCGASDESPLAAAYHVCDKAALENRISNQAARIAELEATVAKAEKRIRHLEHVARCHRQILDLKYGETSTDAIRRLQAELATLRAQAERDAAVVEAARGLVIIHQCYKRSKYSPGHNDLELNIWRMCFEFAGDALAAAVRARRDAGNPQEDK